MGLGQRGADSRMNRTAGAIIAPSVAALYSQLAQEGSQLAQEGSQLAEAGQLITK